MLEQADEPVRLGSTEIGIRVRLLPRRESDSVDPGPDCMAPQGPRSRYVSCDPDGAFGCASAASNALREL